LREARIKQNSPEQLGGGFAFVVKADPLEIATSCCALLAMTIVEVRCSNQTMGIFKGSQLPLNAVRANLLRTGVLHRNDIHAANEVGHVTHASHLLLAMTI
jgi:hypothetical protein